MNDEALRGRVMEEGSAGIAAAAKELGFDVTEEELGEAVKAMRRAEEPQELSLDELDEVSAGGPYSTATISAVAERASPVFGF